MLSGGHLALLIQCMVIKWNGGPHRAARSARSEHQCQMDPACPRRLRVLTVDRPSDTGSSTGPGEPGREPRRHNPCYEI